MKTKLILAALAAIAFGAAAAHAAPVQVRGGYSYYGPGPNYYMQQYPGPNCYAHPHPYYGWICY